MQNLTKICQAISAGEQGEVTVFWVYKHTSEQANKFFRLGYRSQIRNEVKHFKFITQRGMRRCAFWGCRSWRIICKGSKPPKTSKKWAWLGSFQPKSKNLPKRISPKLLKRSTQNFIASLRPPRRLRGWSTVTLQQFKMAAGGHVSKQLERNISAADEDIFAKFCMWPQLVTTKTTHDRNGGNRK